MASIANGTTSKKTTKPRGVSPHLVPGLHTFLGTNNNTSSVITEYTAMRRDSLTLCSNFTSLTTICLSSHAYSTILYGI